ncbi:hypothetical protein TNCT6_64880 [Streptomyces sp. 6-11-2]|nr:hypothetical protein TNCT6_64880 [Streptomyces sp. 6-11-2]
MPVAMETNPKATENEAYQPSSRAIRGLGSPSAGAPVPDLWGPDSACAMTLFPASECPAVECESQ